MGATLRVRSRKFPAVTNCTSIDWFHEWPEEALISVSKRFLSEGTDLQVCTTAYIYPSLFFVVILSKKSTNNKNSFLKKNNRFLKLNSNWISWFDLIPDDVHYYTSYAVLVAVHRNSFFAHLIFFCVLIVNHVQQAAFSTESFIFMLFCYLSFTARPL